MKNAVKRTLAFLEHEAAGGILLFAAAMLALVLANSPASQLYDGLLETPVAVKVGALKLDKPLLHWINDGLMAIFFFLVGLEIKRELLAGELSPPRQAALPVLAALGGMVVLAFAAAFPGASHGLVSISGSAASSPFAIALRSLQREAILRDPDWRNGAYARAPRRRPRACASHASSAPSPTARPASGRSVSGGSASLANVRRTVSRRNSGSRVTSRPRPRSSSKPSMPTATCTCRARWTASSSRRSRAAASSARS